MANFLSALLQGLAPAVDTEVEGITVTPSPKMLQTLPPPPPPAQNPYSTDYIQAAQLASQSQAQLPRVSGATDTGLYGLLPENVRNGRFRDILGAIGDGILLGAGQKAIYQPRADARRMGQALIGYSANPNAALERLANTGVPAAVAQAGTMMGQNQTDEIRKMQYENQMDYRKEQNRIRLDQQLQRLGQFIAPGVLAKANTPKAYESAWERLDQMVKRLDPEANPTTAWGLPDPLDWTPEMTAMFGTTGGQQLTADVGRERIKQQDRAVNTRSADTRASIAQRAQEVNTRSADSRYATDKRAETARLKKPASGLTPKKAGATATSSLKPSAEMVRAYKSGTPTQRAQARKAWRDQGYDIRELK